MTTNADVKQRVLERVKQIARPGQPITKTLWKTVYNMVRLDAIAETKAWKRKYITIEETI